MPPVVVAESIPSTRHCMNVFLTVLSLLFCTALAGTAADSPAEESPSGVVQELWFGIPGGSVKDLTHQKVFERPSSDIRKIVRLDAENLGDQYGARYSALLRVPDHMSVAWSGPGIPQPVLVPASALFLPPGMLPEEKPQPQTLNPSLAE